MPGRGHRWRRHGGRSRRVARLLEPVLLLLLREGLAHGYALLERLREFGLEDVDPSVVYRTLRDMEASGWITSTWEAEQTQGPPRRVYRLTATGGEVLTLWIQDLEETRRLIDRVLEIYHHYMEQAGGEYH